VESRVVELEHGNSPVKVTTSNGKQYTFDFVVGADGLKSTVRAILFPESKPRAATNNAAYRAVLPYKEVFEKVPDARRIFGNTIDVWQGGDSYCITYPMTAGEDLNFVLSHHTKEIQHVPIEADMAELRSMFGDYEQVVQDVIALIPQSQRWPLLMVDPLPTWSNASKNVVLMGDAAHGMVNHMAQGAATSMEDGIFLGRTMSDVVRGVISLEEAVHIYEKQRMPRSWTKQQASFTFGEINFTPEIGALRSRASAPEFSAPNVTNYQGPPPQYRSWNLWGHAESSAGVYGYDAESDADNAVCQYLQEQGQVNENTKVAERLRGKWMAWTSIEAKAVQEHT
jgi:salicylate hydroxylase